MSGQKRLWIYAALSLTVASSANAAEALVTKGDESYRFIVSQCLQDVARRGSPSRVDLQLDGVPAETPAAIIEKLRGVTNDPAAAGKLLQEVVRAGPVLSVTRLRDGGDMIGVTDLRETNWTSDPAVTDAGARFLELERSGTTLHVKAETMSDGEVVTLKAECPN